MLPDDYVDRRQGGASSSSVTKFSKADAVIHSILLSEHWMRIGKHQILPNKTAVKLRLCLRRNQVRKQFSYVVDVARTSPRRGRRATSLASTKRSGRCLAAAWMLRSIIPWRRVMKSRSLQRLTSETRCLRNFRRPKWCVQPMPMCGAVPPNSMSGSWLQSRTRYQKALQCGFVVTATRAIWDR
jgi:hypothetical protein